MSVCYTRRKNARSHAAEEPRTLATMSGCFSSRCRTRSKSEVSWPRTSFFWATSSVAAAVDDMMTGEGEKWQGGRKEAGDRRGGAEMECGEWGRVKMGQGSSGFGRSFGRLHPQDA